MHYTLTALMAERYHRWVRWELGTHAPPGHEDMPHLGGETGDGWYDLQDRLFHWWARRDEHWILAQVKEKFGRLTVYADPDVTSGSEPAQPDWRPIRYLALASQRVCEHCGAPGRLAEGGGWFSTVCERHRSFVAQDRDAAERDACLTADAVLTCMADQRTRPSEPGLLPDIGWVMPASTPHSPGHWMQALDAAITWLLELDLPLLHPADLETVVGRPVAIALALPWTAHGLPRSTVVAHCHTALRSAEGERQTGGCQNRPCIVHLPDVFVLPR